MPLKSLNTTITTPNYAVDVPDWNGRLGAFLVSGTFDGATVKLQHMIGDEWVDIGADVSVSSSGGGQFITPQSDLRVRVSGGGAALNVKALVKPLVI